MRTMIGVPAEVLYYNCCECGAPLHTSQRGSGFCEACEYGWIASPRKAYAAALAEQQARDFQGLDVIELVDDYPDKWGMQKAGENG